MVGDGRFERGVVGGVGGGWGGLRTGFVERLRP